MPVRVDGDNAAVALTRAYVLLARQLTDAWADRRTGAMAVVTGLPVPTLNAVIADDAAADPVLVAELLGRVSDAGVPHCLQCRPEARDSLTDVAAAGSLRAQPDVPLMALDLADARFDEDSGVLHVRVLEPDEASAQARIAAAGFEAPEQIFRDLVPPALLAADGVRCYVGEVAGEPVTTALGIALGGSVGIFNVATPPAHRGRGYGGAVTARAVRDGITAGASWAWLQSSNEGLSLYRELGFRTLEQWPCWVSA